MSILTNIEYYITKHTLLEHNSTIIIGLSGGPDSVFLLHMLIAVQKKYNLTLIAAHLNHEWRPEADAEEELCHALAQKHNITFVSAKLSALKQTHKYNGSKEEFARSMRRHFLQNVLHEYNADCIALGHHAQDQQETFFIRLIRGTSLAGLTGMHSRHGVYIRPLLETNKADIVEWLDENGITYAIDASNKSGDYLRNRIRSNVIPALAACDTRWNSNFLTTLARLQHDDALLNDIALSTLATLVSMLDDKEVLDIKQFMAVNPSLHHRILVVWLIKNNVQFTVTQAFLDEIIRFLSHERGGIHAVHEGWVLVKKRGKVFVMMKRNGELL